MRRTGFSLVELMIVVALISILAAIAIPSWQAATLRARRSEAKPVMSGIGDAQVAYNVAFDVYVAGASNPGSPIGKDTKPWNPSMTGWTLLDFVPDGELRCTYITNCFTSCTWARVDGYCDVDDDNNIAVQRYYVPTATTTGSGSSQRGNGYFTDLNPTWY